MKNVQTYLYYIFLFIYGYSYSQTISSKIVDENNSPISNVTALITNQENKNIAFAITDNQGLFLISLKEKCTNCKLTLRSFGLEKKSFKLLDSQENMGIQKLLQLKYEAEELQELSITIKQPITIKKDTIVYNIKDFTKGNERVLEDLLKNLPGIDVAKDGTVKVSGQEVEKIMVDGTDFFEKGYKVLTKNIPIKPLSEVEILKNHSNNKHLKGIEDSNKIALNITLQEEFKNIWFGNTEAGSGYDDKVKHLSRTNILNFNKKIKTYYLLSSNNMNYNISGDLNAIVSSNLTNLFESPYSPSLLSFSHTSLSIDNKRYQSSNNNLLSINNIYTPNENWNIKLAGILSTNSFKTQRESVQHLFDSSDVYTFNDKSRSKNKQDLNFLRLDINHDFNINNSILYTVKGSNTNLTSKGFYQYNDKNSSSEVRGKTPRIEQDVEYTNKLSKNKVLIINGKNIYDETTQSSLLTPNLYLNTPSSLFNQNVFTKVNFTALKINYMNKFENGDLVEFSIGNTYTSTALRTYVEGYSPIQSTQKDNNNLSLKTNKLYLNSKYSKEFGNLKIIPFIDFIILNNKLKNTTTTLDNKEAIIAPKIELQWIPNDQHRINVNYRQNYTNVKMDQLLENYVQSSFRNFVKGTSNLEPLTNSALGIYYTLGNYSDRVFANVFFNYTHYNDFYSKDISLYENYTLSKSMIIQNSDSYQLNTNLNYYLKKLKNNIKITLGISQSEFYNSINSTALRKVQGISINYGIEVSSIFDNFFNYKLSTLWYNSTVKTDRKDNFIDNETSLNLHFTLNESLVLDINADSYSFGDLVNNRKLNVFFDSKLNYRPIGSNWNFSYELNNIFNQKYYTATSITDFNHTVTKTNLVPRQFLFSVNYSF
ncbi:TonB-dependent receptor [Myroides profundi]|uniref:Outer membrane receptor proteins, mostly Fe transport n=1 Tax=Myroides profundi TaxID=480520 RepID=A0AAJ4W4N4_MYRPR|nr:TonB-dependent receptor [Myroides profundi]AJH15525.1 hypothetical protein MPR_2354 [Myroides profundi]SER07747.1 Outer membrane receptor proteins, mostly Fe transport [Myroides profundi]